jgi:hypothetical protein
MTGKIMCILAVMHYLNMAVLLLLSHRHHYSTTNKL